MAAVIQPVCDSADPAPSSTPRLYSVVRQPILDLHGRVHAYELLFRGDAAPDGVSALQQPDRDRTKLRPREAQRVEKVDGKAHRICALPVAGAERAACPGPACNSHSPRDRAEPGSFARIRFLMPADEGAWFPFCLGRSHQCAATHFPPGVGRLHSTGFWPDHRRSAPQVGWTDCAASPS